MSFKWPPKDKDEVLDYSVDWSRWLAGATISSITWYVDDASNTKTVLGAGQVVNGLQNVAQTISGGVSTINLGLGTNNAEYKITCAMSDNTGNLVERVIRLKIKEN
jgi:hypothetical protein